VQSLVCSNREVVELHQDTSNTDCLGVQGTPALPNTGTGSCQEPFSIESDIWRSANCPGNASPVKQILRNKYHTEVTVMSAFRKQIANLFGIRLVQEVVENEETWQATCRLAKFG
jgi:hypothetical protein